MCMEALPCVWHLDPNKHVGLSSSELNAVSLRLHEPAKVMILFNNRLIAGAWHQQPMIPGAEESACCTAD